MKPVRFFNFDARVGIFLVLVMVHARLWTLLLFIFVLAVFWVLERKGLTFPAALRAARVWMLGPNRSAWYWFRKRKLLDTGSR
jgi:hypothetical protein